MCCCGCALSILMEESRLASGTGFEVQHSGACEAGETASHKQSNVWQAIARWITSACRPRDPDTTASTERSAVA